MPLILMPLLTLLLLMPLLLPLLITPLAIIDYYWLHYWLLLILFRCHYIDYDD
jgi:hypothetical protein